MNPLEIGEFCSTDSLRGGINVFGWRTLMLKLLCMVTVAYVAAKCPAVYGQAPSTPTNLVVQSTAAGSATLKWDGPVSGVQKYTVYYGSTAGVTPQNTPKFGSTTNATITITGLDNEPWYFILVASNASGDSTPTAPISATPPASNPAANGTPQVNGAQTNNAVSSSAGDNLPDSNVGSDSNTDIQTPTVSYTQLLTLPVGLSSDNGALSYDEGNVQTLIKQACSATSSTFDADAKNGSTYAMINIIHLNGSNGSQSVKPNNWYVYSQGKTLSNGFPGGWKVSNFNGKLRLYGATKVFLVSIVVNDSQVTAQPPQINYTITTTKQDATNIADVKALMSIVAPNAALQNAIITNWMGCAPVKIAWKTSSIKIDSASKSGVPTFTATQTFTNEGKTHWDVSFALPVKKASALQYSSTANTVTASQINKSDLFAVFDYYPVPADLTATNTSLIPSFFVGVALNSQPLHSFIFGTSVGIRLAQVYAGALLIKQQQLSGLSTGSSASESQVTSATSYAYKPSFTVGIKISIRSAASTLTSAKK
jgi:hypothetical protein